MSTQLTNNTLTLNSVNYTASGTSGAIMPVPTIFRTNSGSTNITLGSVTIGSFFSWYGEIESSGNTERYVRLPSSGSYLIVSGASHNANESELDVSNGRVYSGGTIIQSSGTNYNRGPTSGGCFIRVS